jgi:hypothetical protein
MQSNEIKWSGNKELISKKNQVEMALGIMHKTAAGEKRKRFMDTCQPRQEDGQEQAEEVRRDEICHA